ncbi:MAG: hypothetical protein RUMPE_00258 [Eubacteriales bacterium SKADARSKE-1]|nr:hypothetical protein [Eubacteriales bacterium SKADARSKE-1]
MNSFIMSCIAGIISGILAAMGLGGGGFLIIYLTLFENISQSEAQGINLIFFIPIAITALIMHARGKLIDWKFALKFGALGLVGAILGCKIALFIDGGLLRKLFGILLLIIGSFQLKKEKK